MKQETDLELKTVDERFKLMLRLMKFSGIWFRGTFSSKWKAVLYNCYSLFVYSVFFLNITLLLLFVVLSAQTFEDVAETCNIIIIQSVFAVKFHPFLFRKQEVENIIAGLEKHTYIHGSKYLPRQSEVAERVLKSSRYLVFMFYGMQTTISIFMVMTPLSVELASDRGNTSSRALPFPQWYPFDLAVTQNYIVALTQQIIWVIGGSLSFVGLPSLFYFLLIVYTTAQFELLGVSLRNAKEHVLLRLKETCHRQNTLNHSPEDRSNEGEVKIDAEKLINCSRENGSSVSYTQNEFYEELYKYLMECVHHHQSLLEYVRELDSFTSPIYFWEIGTGALVICVLGFNLLTVPLKSIAFLTIFLHLCYFILLMGFLCWFGSRLNTFSEDLSIAAYECEWYDTSPAIKYTLLMIIGRAQRPATLTAGYFGPLHLPLFSKIMETAYSYFAILKKMQEG